MFRFSMLSSLYVAAAMPAGVKVEIVDEEVETVDFETDVDLIGISFMTFNALQATVLTPFPGTPLFEELRRQGRITDRDWSHYDFGHVVFEPARMGAATLKAGHRWVLQKYYSRAAIGRRLWSGLRYLPWSTVLRATGPLNLSYRTRLGSAGFLSPSQPWHQVSMQRPDEAPAKRAPRAPDKRWSRAGVCPRG